MNFIKHIFKEDPYFLSIDIDVFNEWLHYEESFIWLCRLSRLCRNKRIKISACMNHQQMLPLVNKTKARGLINFDYHSDMFGETDGYLNCATWIDYIKWKSEGKYLWIRQDSHMRGDIGEMFEYDRAGAIRISGWKNIFARTDFFSVPDRLVKNACEVCVCMSPSYSLPEHIRSFRWWVEACGIRYRKGKMNEDEWYSYSR